MDRSSFLLTSLGSLLAASSSPSATDAALTQFESHYGGSIGLAAQDLGDGTLFRHRADERFPLASTQKLPLVMTVLAAVQNGKLSLDQMVAFTPAELEDDTKTKDEHPHGGSLAVRTLCELTMSFSDNTTADLLSPLVGGPAGVGAYLATLGLSGMRVDRTERQLPPIALRSEPRDTTTPFAMMQLLESLYTGRALSQSNTRLLLAWMRQNQTGDDRLRAGVPKGWSVADKTGTYRNARNDVGFLFPPLAKPIVVAVYAFGQTPPNGERAIAACARFLTSHA